MSIQEYKEKAKRTLPDLTFKETAPNVFERVCEDTVGLKLNLTHMMLGLNGEIGELVQCVGTELKGKVDRVNLREELGDIYWYITNYVTLRSTEKVIPIPEEVKITATNDMCLDLLIISVAELTDIVKRLVAYNKEIDRHKEVEAVYNIYAALHLFESAYDMEGSIIREKNIAKLMVRFPDKYSDIAALNRNTDNEHKTLE